MICMFCESKTKILESRFTKTGDKRRRRECLSCGQRFESLETYLDKPPPKKRKPKTKAVLKRKTRRAAKPTSFLDLDFDNMTDEEIEALL